MRITMIPSNGYHGELLDARCGLCDWGWRSGLHGETYDAAVFHWKCYHRCNA